MEAAAADWSEVPMDLLELIVRRLDRLPDDHVRFGAVCESWRSVAIENRCHLPLNQFPGLMVPGIDENSQTRCFFQLNHDNGFFEEHANYSKQLEVPHGHACSGSAYGWLLLTDDELNTELLNPFSGAKIQLPSVATLPPALEGFHPRIKGYVFKAAFSSNPSCFQQPYQPTPVILIIYGGSMPRLAYCRLGDEAWTALECLSNQKHYFMDAIYYRDRFFALNSNGVIMALDINVGRSFSGTTTSTDHSEVKVTQYASISGIQFFEDMFLVESEGALVVLMRKEKYRSLEISDSDSDSDDHEDISDSDSDSDSDDHEDDDDEDDEDDDNYEGTDYRNAYSYGNFRTAGFTMLRLGTSEDKWVKVNSLGDNALFLGYNTSFSLRASDYPGCIPNSIYFTQCTNENGGYDMGIYNLTDKSVKPLYIIGSRLTKPSPIWITRLPSVLKIN